MQHKEDVHDMCSYSILLWQYLLTVTVAIIYCRVVELLYLAVVLSPGKRVGDSNHRIANCSGLSYQRYPS